MAELCISCNHKNDLNPDYSICSSCWEDTRQFACKGIETNWENLANILKMSVEEFE